MQSLPSDHPTPPTKLDSADNGNIWTWLMRSRGNNPTLVETAPIIEHPKVVKVSPARGFQVNFTLILYRLLFLLETKLTETGCNEAETQDKVVRSDIQHSSRYTEYK